MIPKNLNIVTLKRTEENVTGRMGLGWIGHSLKDFGLEKIIKQRYKGKHKSNRQIKASRKIESGILMFISGAQRIEDIETLRADKGLIKTLGWKSMIAADTLREFIKEKKNAGKMRQINNELVKEAIKKSGITEFTYDNDATYIDSNKESAKYSYQNKKQYSALLGFIKELNLCNTVDFRRGNVSPAEGILNQLRKAVKQVKEAGGRIIRFRSDSAAHSNEIFRECNKENIKYYISLSKNTAIKEIIKGLKEKQWKELRGKYKDREQGKKWAESIYVTNKGETARILVLRWNNPNITLFDQEEYCYHVIGTNDKEIEAMDWLEMHNGRMNSENYNKEVKSGYNCKYTPSNDFEMNRGYFLMGILAYNAVQIMKQFYLTKGTKNWTIKTIRYHFINICGKIIKTGRKYICKIINVTEEVFELFRKCLYHLKMG